jgi:FSR family fosmidomycin resistance protein-like MFS transporter
MKRLFLQWFNPSGGYTRLPVLYGLHFLNDGLQGALLVVLPFLAEEMGLTETQIGWVVFACFLLGALFAAPASIAARALGGRWLLLAVVPFSGLCFIAASLTTSFCSVLIVYLIAGIGFGVFHPMAFALLARDSGRHSTSRVMGLFTAAGDVGRILVVAMVVGLLSFLPWRPLFVAMGAPVVIGGLVFALLAWPKARAEQQTRTARQPVRRLSFPADSGFWFLCAIGFCDGLANSSLYVFLPFLLLAKGCEPAQLTVLMPLFFVACLSGRMVMAWLGDRCGRVGGLLACQAAIAGAIAGLCLSRQIVWVGICVSLLGIVTRGSLPLIQALTADRLPREKVESGFAVNQMVLGVAATLSPLFLGHVSRIAGMTTAFGLAAVLCVVNVGLVLALRTACSRPPAPETIALW